MSAYTIDDRDRVVAFPAIPAPDAGAPEPVVEAHEHLVRLAYFPSDGSISSDQQKAVVEFRGCKSFLFGMPNDETLDGHPLWERGLHFYQPARVLESSWVRQVERMASVHDQHSPSRFSELLHLIIPFHDSTFECLTDTFSVQQTVNDDDAS